MKTLYKLTLFLVVLFPASSALACTCVQLPFLEVAEFNDVDHVVQYRVTSHGDRQAQGFSYMEGEVIRSFRGNLGRERLRIFGDGGMSCMPYTYRYSVGEDWLLALTEIEGRLFLASCQPRVSIDGDTLTGLITPLTCSGHLEREPNCQSRSPLDWEAAEQLSVDEFELALQLYATAVSTALQACTGPWPRCAGIRPSYNPLTGELTIPALDVRTPASAFGTYGISATLRTENGYAPDSFSVIEFGRLLQSN